MASEEHTNDATLDTPVEERPWPSRKLGLLACVFASAWLSSTAKAVHLPGLQQARANARFPATLLSDWNLPPEQGFLISRNSAVQETDDG